MKEEFLKELKELLDKYDVYITADVEEGSDIYGIFGESISIWHNKENWLYIGNWCLSSQDIKSEEF